MAAPRQLQVVRFGEFLRARHVVTEEQLLSALAHHWSARSCGRSTRLGESLVACGILPEATVASQLAEFCGTTIVEVGVETKN